MSDYLVIYEGDDETGWSAYVPDLPGCVGAGSTRAEVEDLMREAIPLHVAGLRDAGQRVPEPHSVAGRVAA